MAIPAGTHKLGPDNATLTVKTGKTGPAAPAGHNLVIHVTAWEATLDVGADPADSTLALSADGGSLKVQSGDGGAKPLSDKDKKNIEGSIDKDILKKGSVQFTSTSVTPTDGGLSVAGDLTMNKTTKPVSFDLVIGDDGAITGSTKVAQTDHDVKVFSAMFGALKVTDEVEVVIVGSIA
ncbi:MAG TPA: YceI family protein [Solirubrobacteraceae bacterium]|jgi:polyisoprenoid-binding protein YceI|nr:YceI family protein [Solirubrobacteraceae bacterium]